MKIPKQAENYLDEKFPKGDKRRGEAMVLLALALIDNELEAKKTK